MPDMHCLRRAPHLTCPYVFIHSAAAKPDTWSSVKVMYDATQTLTTETLQPHHYQRRTSREGKHSTTTIKRKRKHPIIMSSKDSCRGFVTVHMFGEEKGGEAAKGKAGKRDTGVWGWRDHSFTTQTERDGGRKKGRRIRIGFSVHYTRY